jgi:AhpD family alkylhydroperoxidase
VFPKDPITRRRLLRAYLLLLAVPQVLIGVWALVDPSGWYTTFPGGGREWLPLFGSYDEHLARDVGSSFLALGVLLLLAALWLDRRVVLAAGAAYLTYQVPHFIYHLTADDVLSTGDQILNGVLLALGVFTALALFELSRPARSAPAKPASDDAPGYLRSRPKGLFARSARWYTRRNYGGEMAPVNAFLHHKPLLMGYSAFETALEQSHRIDDRFKYLGEMKAAGMAGCEWCMDFGSKLALERGLTEQQLIDLPRWHESDAYDDVERLVIELAVGMTTTPVQVPEELIDRLKEHFDDAQLVELTSAIALENFRARFNHALGFEVQGFSEGAVCVRPEARPGAAEPQEPAPAS